MVPHLPPLRFVGASALKDGQLTDGPIAIAEGRIVDDAWTDVDLTGFLILPGIVDLCGADLKDFDINSDVRSALHRAEQAALRHGITTGFVRQGWSLETAEETPATARRAMRAAAENRRTGRALSDFHVALVIEIHTTETGHDLIDAAVSHGLRLAYFRDTLDDFLKHHRGSATVETLEKDKPSQGVVARYLCTLATEFDAMGLRYGSLAVSSAEAREHYSLIGARLCALPATDGVARAADAVGDPVFGHAGEVLKGMRGSPDTRALVQSGHCSALTSGGEPRAMAEAAWHLVEAGILHLSDAWSLISEKPARLLGLTDRGRLAEGLRADLTILNATTRTVEMTVCAGRLAYVSGPAADRLRAAGPAFLDMAAE